MNNLYIDEQTMKIIMNVINDNIKKSKINRLELFKELNKTAKSNSIVFAGDSIIQRYPLDEMIQIDKKIYNRGIDGLESIELLDNINIQMLDLKPDIVFIMIGTNDLGVGVMLEEIVARIKKIIQMIRNKLPMTKVHIISLCPINEEIINSQPNYLERKRTNVLLCKLNQMIIDKIAKPFKINFIDIHRILVDKSGNLKREYTTDGLHLSAKAYRKITEIIVHFL